MAYHCCEARWLRVLVNIVLAAVIVPSAVKFTEATDRDATSAGFVPRGVADVLVPTAVCLDMS